MMEWLAEDPKRGQFLLCCIAVGITAIGFWLGRKKLLVTIPCALLFLLLTAVAIPGFIPARYASWRNACLNNLQQIREAKTAWATKYHKLPTQIPTEQDLYGTNGFLRRELACPRGGKYTFGAVGENPTCSFPAKGHKLE